MPYNLKSVTLRADNSEESMGAANAFWEDIMSGKTPLLYDNEKNLLTDIFALVKYSNFESDETGAFDLTVSGEPMSRVADLDKLAADGAYVKYYESGDSIESCGGAVWTRVWEDNNSGAIKRAYAGDYEITTPPEMSPDGKAHCALYITVL